MCLLYSSRGFTYLSNKTGLRKKIDYLLIESTGISEPLPVAETFTFEDEDGVSLSDVSKLDTMVTVVDAVNFTKEYGEAKDLQIVDESLGEEGQCSVTDLLVDQVEFADIILISKTDLVNQKDIDKLKAFIRNLNNDARVIPISKGNVSTADILSTGLFDFAGAQQDPGWLIVLRREHTSETEEYGISSFVYKARRPFYPKKFHDFLHSKELSGKLIRSKGYFWLATRHQFVGNWSQAGGIAHHGFAGMFWNAIPKSQWPTDKESIDFIKEKWEDPFGDMRQELVFIGQGSDQKKITKFLDECLLSDAELLLGKDHWAQFPDPFPEWGEAA